MAGLCCVLFLAGWRARSQERSPDDWWGIGEAAGGQKNSNNWCTRGVLKRRMDGCWRSSGTDSNCGASLALGNMLYTMDASSPMPCTRRPRDACPTSPHVLMEWAMEQHRAGDMRAR